MQGGQTADGCVQRGDAVDYGHAGPDGGHVVVAGEHGDAGHGLADGVVADLVTVGAELTVGGDVDHDDAGVDLLQFFVAEAHLFDGAGPEVLDQNIGDCDQLPEGLFTLFFAEVHGQGFLARVVLDPVRGLLLNPGAVVTGLLTAQTLNLDDLGAHSGQYLGAARAGLMTA